MAGEKDTSGFGWLLLFIFAIILILPAMSLAASLGILGENTKPEEKK